MRVGCSELRALLCVLLWHWVNFSFSLLILLQLRNLNSILNQPMFSKDIIICFDLFCGYYFLEGSFLRVICFRSGEKENVVFNYIMTNVFSACNGMPEP